MSSDGMFRPARQYSVLHANKARRGSDVLVVRGANPGVGYSTGRFACGWGGIPIHAIADKGKSPCIGAATDSSATRLRCTLGGRYRLVESGLLGSYATPRCPSHLRLLLSEAASPVLRPNAAGVPPFIARRSQTRTYAAASCDEVRQSEGIDWGALP